MSSELLASMTMATWHSSLCCSIADYQLLVYGNKRQDEVYCAKCERLIKKLGMQDHVFIMGLAKPAEILRQGWIYLQVSFADLTLHYMVWQ